MKRRPNKSGPSTRDPTTEFDFLPHEFKTLKINTPGPSGRMGGYQDMENDVIACTDAVLHCTLTDELFARLCRLIKRHGPGGPNKRLRTACVPALRRIGIDLVPEWRVR